MNDYNVSKNIIDKLVELNKLEEIANIQPRTTKLKTILYATFNGEHSGYPHDARVKIGTSCAGLFPILLRPVVKPLNKNGLYDNLQKPDKTLVDDATKYVKLHCKEFIEHWCGNIGDNQLRKVLTGEFTLDQAIQDAIENGLD